MNTEFFSRLHYHRHARSSQPFMVLGPPYCQLLKCGGNCVGLEHLYLCWKLLSCNKLVAGCGWASNPDIHSHRKLHRQCIRVPHACGIMPLRSPHASLWSMVCMQLSVLQLTRLHCLKRMRLWPMHRACSWCCGAGSTH